MKCRRLLHLTVLAIILLSGCGYDATFLGDSALLVAADPAALSAELRSAARSSGVRLQTIWQPAETLSGGWLDSAAAASDTPFIVLSPFLSVFAEEVASQIPDRTLIAFYGPESTQSNLIRVHFDAIGTMEEVGAYLGRWVSSSPGRAVSALFLEASEQERHEHRVLEQSYVNTATTALETERFAVVPDREQVRQAIGRIPAADERLIVVFLGSATATALEFLTPATDQAIVRHGIGVPLADAGIAGAVQDDLPRAVGAVFDEIRSASEPISVVVVQSVFRTADGEADER